jgi:serine O-acetyltransferase
MYIFQDFYKIKPISVLWGLFIGNTLRAIFIFRISSWLHTHHFKILSMLLWSLNITLHSCDISPNAKIGKGLYIYHSVGIVIGCNVLAGDNLTLYQNITIGANKSTKYPVIGNNVSLYAGCVVIGDINIGNNVLVGANSVVTKDIPNNSISKGVPATYCDLPIL